MTKKNSKMDTKKSCIITILIGLAFTVIGYFISINGVKLLFTGEKVEGTITEVFESLEEDDDGGSHYMYTPKVKYNCAGTSAEGMGSRKSSTHYRVGGKLTVYCDANNPNNFEILSNILISLVFPLMGLLCVFIGIFSLKGFPSKTGQNNQESLNHNTNSKQIYKKIKIDLTYIIFIFCAIIFGLVGIALFSSGEIIFGLIFLIVPLILLYAIIIKLKDSLRRLKLKKLKENGFVQYCNATVNGFKFTSEVMGEKNYEICLTDGVKIYKSGRISGTLTNYNDYSYSFFEYKKIIYNPKNPEECLSLLENSYDNNGDNSEENSQLSQNNNILGNIKGGINEIMNLSKNKIIEELKEQIREGDEYEFPYGTFNGKKISIGDTLRIIIDPNNPDVYDVDLDFLYDEK